MLEIKSLCYNAFSVNTYVVFDNTKECVIVDPGMSNRFEMDSFFSFINDNQLIPKLIMITHGHIDHIAGCTALVRKYGLKVASHPEAREYFASAQQQAQMFGFAYDEQVFFPDEELQEGDEIQVGKSILEMISTPGHAKGSLSFYAPAEGFVLTGDALFCRSIGRTDFPGGNYEELRQSIREKLFVLPEDTVVYPGHGEPTSIEEERDFNPFVAM
jgi:Zn-dependent hydrolases, including glyoxylases